MGSGANGKSILSFCCASLRPSPEWKRFARLVYLGFAPGWYVVALSALRLSGWERGGG